MLTVLILVVFVGVVLVLILLAVVVVAIRQEPRDAEMSNVAPSLIAVMVRRLLGVYLRRPARPVDSTEWQEEWSPDMPPANAQSRPPSGRR
jgi:NADH:ubiquinone oxidoreductase subunit 6 (subunit J)